MKHVEKKLAMTHSDQDAVWWTLQELTGPDGPHGSVPVWFDIETTGLSPRNQEIYLTGAVFMENDSLTLHQWFSDGGPEEEAAILKMFIDHIPENAALISFNGDTFDLPFIKKRSLLYGVNDIPETCRSLDLFRTLRKYKNLLGLTGTKQISFEQRLGIGARAATDGHECIRLYRQYSGAVQARSIRQSGNTGDDTEATEEQLLTGIRDTLLLHNEEDLLGLIRIGSLLSCRQLTQGKIRILSARTEPEGLLCLFKTERPLPVSVEFREPGLYLQITGDQGQALLASREGKCRLYHDDYKNYEYLPGEDMAVHRSLSAFIDRSLKEPATRQNCHTPVACTPELAIETDKCQTILKSNLKFYLG